MKTVLKTIAIWLIMVICAIFNGLLRDRLLNKLLGTDVALPVSGIVLSCLIGLIVYAAIPFFGSQNRHTFLGVGLGLVLMTLVFETVFGMMLGGKSWHEILQLFDVTRGNLFSLVLLVTLLSPYLTAKWRGYLYKSTS